MINAICTCNFISNNIKGNSASEHQRTERTDRTEHPLIRQKGLLNRKPGKTSVYNLCKIFWFIANYTRGLTPILFQIIASILSQVIAMRGWMNPSNVTEMGSMNSTFPEWINSHQDVISLNSLWIVATNFFVKFQIEQNQFKLMQCTWRQCLKNSIWTNVNSLQAYQITFELKTPIKVTK